MSKPRPSWKYEKLAQEVRAAWGGGTSTATEQGYDVASTSGEGKRRTATIETKSEDEILSVSQRLKVLSLTREGMRNAPQVRAIAQQLRVLIVGMLGGKLTMTTDDETWNTEAQSAFASFSKSIDFIDGTCLNDTLKLIITALAVEAGDYAAIHDDGILTGGKGTGKFRFFESDNIANFDPIEFEKRFPKHTQSHGMIYSPEGRWVGIVLSGKKRGKSTFSKDEAFTLTRDPDGSPYDCPWHYGKRKWRLLQGRGISPQTVAIAALLDMYEIVSSEVVCGKLNSSIFAQIIDSLDVEADGSDGSEDVDAGGSDTETDTPPAEGEETPAEEETTATVDTTAFTAASGAKVLNMPSKTKMELLDTKRPNTNMIEFVEWLCGGAAAVHGLARVYSGLKAETSYTAFRGEQTISWTSIEEAQKELERGPLDWIGVRSLRWLVSVGRLAQGPDGWETKLTWSWPTMKEVNEVDAQTAIGAKIKNFMATYRQLLGPNWKEILTQIADEMKWFQEQGLVHPALQTVSGQVVTSGQTDPTKKGSDDEKNRN